MEARVVITFLAGIYRDCFEWKSFLTFTTKVAMLVFLAGSTPAMLISPKFHTCKQ